MNILITINETPYPPYSGGRIDFLYKLQNLKNLGFNVYLIYSYSSKKDDDLFKSISSQYVKECISFPRKKNIIKLFSFVPYVVVSSMPNNNEKRTIQNLLGKIDIDLIVIDHLNSYLIAESTLPMYQNTKIIYRAHNNETLFLYSTFKSYKFLSLKKWILGFDTIKMFFYERRIYSKIANIASISLTEMYDLKKIYPKKNIRWIPPFFDFNERDEILLNENEENVYNTLNDTLSNKKVLLLTGSFSGGFNVESTKWFIDNILYKLIQQNNNLVFVIAGSDSNKYFKDSKNILVIPKYESVKPLMKIADLSIIMATGKGGVKLKLMEALNYRKKIVSTTDGVYGSGFEKLIPNTDDKELFFSYCIDALNGKINYEEAYEYFKLTFNCRQNAINLVEF